MKDKEKVFLPADKGRIMVAMDRYESIGSEESYEYKMKKVLVDPKARPSIRAGEYWDLTDIKEVKVSEIRVDFSWREINLSAF